MVFIVPVNEVPEVHPDPGRALAGSCHKQGNSQTHLSNAYRTTHPGLKALYLDMLFAYIRPFPAMPY